MEQDRLVETYLVCPFQEKDQVKALGAKFDGTRKLWYVPRGKDTAPFKKWLPPKFASSPIRLYSSFHEKNEVKALGAVWNNEERAWFAPVGANLALFTRWMPTKLYSSFQEKDQVKALGAFWNANEKSWYAPAGSDLTKFAKWLRPADSGSAQMIATRATPTVAPSPSVTQSLGSSLESVDQTRRLPQQLHADEQDVISETPKRVKSSSSAVAGISPTRKKSKKSRTADHAEAKDCPICYEDLTEPCALLCGHVFCKKCCQHVVSQRTSDVCPMCRKQSKSFILLYGI
jgi:hypothetical protein